MAPHTSPEMPQLWCDSDAGVTFVALTCCDCGIERYVPKSRGTYSPRCQSCRKRYLANRAKVRREDGRWVKASSRENNLKKYGLTSDAFFRQAAALASELDPKTIRDHAAERYSLEAVAPRYGWWLDRLAGLYGPGWPA